MTHRNGPEAEARTLRAAIERLRAEVAARADRWAAAWARAGLAGGLGASERNFAEYLALREADLRPLQEGLAALGLSSLGRAEAHVGATLAAVAAALARIAGAAGAGAPPFPDRAAFREGRARIAERTAALFGPPPQGRTTRILATLPAEAADDPALMDSLIARGVDAVRINTAHDGPARWQAMAAAARAAAARAGRNVAVTMDLSGPKVRLTAVEGAEGRRLFRGELLALAAGPGATPVRPVGVLSHPALLARLTPGSQVWIDDGKLRLKVVTAGPAAAVVEVAGARDKGVRLRPGKGVAVPGCDLDIPALTEDDLAALDIVAAEADVVGFSFVQRPEDVAALVEGLEARRGGRPRPAILLKIETALAVRNLPQLIVAAAAAGPAGVMIARGDLAVSLGFERLSEIQDEILWLCEAAQVPVVWATQVLDDLLHEGLPTRAEATDAAMAQRAECVMLNKGPHLVQAVAFLADVLARMDRHQEKKFARLGPLNAWRAPD